jgi:hypothetical protein
MVLSVQNVIDMGITEIIAASNSDEPNAQATT